MAYNPKTDCNFDVRLAVGTIFGAPVLAPESELENSIEYVLVYSEADKAFKLTAKPAI